MGRALVREPAVSLLDEPLSNLDAKLRVDVRAEIAELQQRIRTTMLYVTHDQVEAMTLGDRVAVMRKAPSNSSPRRASSTQSREPVRRQLHREPADEPFHGATHRRLKMG